MGLLAVIGPSIKEKTFSEELFFGDIYLKYRFPSTKLISLFR